MTEKEIKQQEEVLIRLDEVLIHQPSRDIQIQGMTDSALLDAIEKILAGRNRK